MHLGLDPFPRSLMEGGRNKSSQNYWWASNPQAILKYYFQLSIINQQNILNTKNLQRQKKYPRNILNTIYIFVIFLTNILNIQQVIIYMNVRCYKCLSIILWILYIFEFSNRFEIWKFCVKNNRLLVLKFAFE